MSSYITAYCTIDRHACKANGRHIYEPETAMPFDAYMKDLYRQTGHRYSKFFKMDGLCKLAYLTAEYLLGEIPLSQTYPADQVGLVLANASASLDTDMAYHRSMKDIPSPSLFVYTLPNIMLGELSIRHGFTGESACLVMPQFEAQTLAEYVNMLMEAELLQACITGWVDKMEEHYESVLFLVEKYPPAKRQAAVFHAQTLNELWKH